jgi:hypothetical protein
MSNADKLKKYISSLVEQEIRRTVPELVREVMAEVVGNMIMESKAELPTANSHKRRSLQEASFGHPSEMEAYPDAPVRAQATGFDRSRMASLMGYGDVAPTHASTGKTLIVSSAITEHGTDVPVDPNSLPDHVIDALTKDYRPVMAAIAAKKNGHG